MKKPRFIWRSHCTVLALALACLVGPLTGSASADPEPPLQSKHWAPPKTDFSEDFVSGIQFLFDTGLADPRGCVYREYTLTLRSLWATNTIAAHGWVLPVTREGSQNYAVAWDGLVYPVDSVGKRVSLKDDIEALLQSDTEWRASLLLQTNGLNFRDTWSWNSPAFCLSETNMTPIKAALLLRLRQGKLARDFWQAWTSVRMIGETKEDAADPFRNMAYEWTVTQYGRGIGAFMRGEDGPALSDFHKLSIVWPALEAETRRRGYWPPVDGDNRALPYYGFLRPLPLLLTDEVRRVADHARGPTNGVAALIANLDDVSAGDMWQWDTAVRALVAVGDPAVGPLLDCLDHNTALTRSIEWGHDGMPRYVVPVKDLARRALDDILRIQCDSPAEYRAYWEKYRAVPPPERWYQTLRDDTAGRQQWMQAARNILGRTDGTVFYLWRNTPVPDATNGFTYVCESLRTRSHPSIGELFLKRALDLAPTNYENTIDNLKFVDSADLGLMLAEWDGVKAGPRLKQIIERCPVLFYDGPGAWSSSANQVPMRFARLAVTMGEVGDGSGLELYADWIRYRKYAEISDALPGVLLPLGHFPNYPAIQDASAQFFRQTNAHWLEIQSPAYDLLSTRLLLNRPFQGLVLNALTNTTAAGTIVLKENGDFEIDAHGSGWTGPLERDGKVPKPGQRIAFRVCDDVARRLSRVEGLPVFRLYWPETARDESLRNIIQYLQSNGDHLTLTPARWPDSNDD